MRRILLPLALLTSLLWLISASAQVNPGGAGVDTTTPTATPKPTPLFSPEIKIADIIATASALIALGSLALAWLQRQETKEQKMRAVRAEAEARALAKRLFYKAGAVAWELKVTNFEGSALTTCRWEDVEVIPQGEMLTHINGDLRYAPPDSQITQYPKLVRHYFRGEPKLEREIELECQETSNSCDYNLRIVGSLPHGYKLSYAYEALVSKGVFMTKEDVIAKAPSTFRKEYWGHYVVTPVDRIEIFISFPEGYRVSRFFVGACIGSLPSAQTMHGEEIQRILTAGSFEPGENWARLKIESPYIGFSYLIYWDPPSQKEVDALKLVYEPLPQGEGGATHG